MDSPDEIQTKFVLLKPHLQLPTYDTICHIFLDANNLINMRSITHIILHFLVPGIISRIEYKDKWIHSYLIMISALVIDLDHLIADPIYDPNRCSIGFHPLHSYAAIVLYIMVLFIPKSRILGIGLLIHIGLDFWDCIWMKFF